MKHIFKILPSLVLIISCVGCNTLSDVKKELAKGGFVLWYPAEANIQPGQIWQTDGERRLKEDRLPQGLTIETNAAAFESLTKEVDAKLSLNASFVSNTLGTVGDLSVALTNAGVKNVSLDFGTCQIQRITLSDLRDTNVIKQFPQVYQEDLKRVEGSEDGYVVIAATVVSSGLQYTFTFTNTATFQANAPAIAKAISAGLDFNLVSGTKAVWNIPSDKQLVIGFMPVSGPVLGLSREQVIKSVGRQLKQMRKQNLIKLMRNLGTQINQRPQ